MKMEKNEEVEKLKNIVKELFLHRNQA